jgi:type VI secretion system protein ImpJ
VIHSSKILWGEGLFLRPQHFQRQDAYHEWRLSQAMQVLHPYAWGLRNLRIDTASLASGVLRIDEVSLVLPDGDFVDAPADDALPAAFNLSSVPAGMTEVVMHAAVAPTRVAGANYAAAGEADGEARRFAHHTTSTADLFTQAAQADVSFLRRALRIVADHEPRDHLVSMPLCRLRRNAAGAFELDTAFVGPSLHLQAVPELMSLLRRMIDMLQAKVDALYGFHREPSRHVIEFRSGDIASFWLLHTTSTACAGLIHLRQHPGLHPERLYARLVELAGALLTFSKRFRLSDLPAYDHHKPGASFRQIEEMLRELLETVISTRYFSITLHEAKPSFHVGRLDSGNIGPGTAFYIGVSAAMPGTELTEVVPLRFKVGAPEDVDKLVLSATAGVRITHLTQVPAAIPVRPGAHYFAIEPRGPLYERMLQAQTITIYAPSGITDLKMELMAVNA